jgi:hypothetical protein
MDAATGESIPYATIKINASENLISNAEGYFALASTNSEDTTLISVTYLGFLPQEITIAQLKKQDYVVKMLPAVYELQDVTVSNSKPDPNQIMATVKAQLRTNYTTDEKATKDKIFYRVAEYFNPSVIEVDIEQSTGFTKQALTKVNSDIKAYSKKVIAHPPVSFTDVLCDYYSVKTKKDDKFVFSSKLNVTKGTVLKQEGLSTSMDDLEKVAQDLMVKHLDTTKFYRIKSGLIGSRDTISFSKSYNKKHDQKDSIKNQLTATKQNLNQILRKANFLNSDTFDFIQNPDRYDYTLEGTTYINQQESAYVLRFKPRKSKAKYTGKLYVSDTDYAVLRADYGLAEGERVFGLNLKFLLGIKIAENLSKGTIVYTKNAGDNYYHLQYAATETGGTFYIKRPLKLIELTKGEKDVLALDFKMEASTRHKTEVVNLERTATSAEAIKKIKEVDFKYLTIPSYDPKIWKDYNSIEPLQEMKQFKTVH